MTTRTTTLMTLVLMVLGAAFSRLIPHPWNFTAIGATALFGGAYFPSKRLSMVIPLAALFLSDLVLGFHPTILFVYVPFVAIVMMGWSLRGNTRSPMRLVTASLVASSVFFLVSNFGVWMTEAMYAKSFQGLVTCYVAAIPFFDNQIYGDLFFTGVLFGSFELLKQVAPEVFAPKAA